MSFKLNAWCRVQGRGPVIIKGVSAFKAGRSAATEGKFSSDLLDTLTDKRQRIVNAKERAEKARLVIGRYMDGITIEHLDISKLGEATDVYDETDGKWEEKIWSLEDQLRDVDRNIREEKDKLSQGEIPVKLRTRVVLDLHAAVETELDIVLIYAVSNAQWEAEYDLRVDMQNQKQPVKLTYKARISQDTAEDWTNVPITLETARPASGIDMPSLYPWNIHYHEPLAVSASGKGRTRQTARMATGGKAARRMLIPRDENDLSFQASDVTSTGHVNATFRVPGLSTIPADGEEHGVVIAELDDLDAIVGWVCIPKFGTSVHLEARVTNTSAYTLIEGPTSAK
ncbi:hypothetical protein D9613_009536 [Agrocybe pediades]|uniref:DUF4139 domain-containing protein n=1 Tax=Agrocybe pediades TaxID=84607 RepID=A0A8H4R5H4_9AGAR|nr:hypothetical protein D9613_009536 [Agrocybe pediades]